MTSANLIGSCSFCGIERSRVEHLFVGPGVAICDVCAHNCCSSFEEMDAQQQVLEPERLAAAIASGLGWGPMNVGAAVRANFRCEYCSKRLLQSLDAYYSWEIDHIVPGAGDHLDNCALSCRTCNHLKHIYHPSGASREERICDARREIQRRRANKHSELQSLRRIIGLPELIQ